MCGRYALGIRASFVRHQLQQQGLPVEDAPEDGVARETYNFPPGAYGLVYRADIPDHGVSDEHGEVTASAGAAVSTNLGDTKPEEPPRSSQNNLKEYRYQLKAMKWGLIPFWTKRSPDYGSMLRTINCRDDSLIENRGMWNTMKQRKRCLVIAQGFYEWLKNGPGGKEKIPHFVKRKDGELMLFAGLWDCVRYEGSEEKLYTYTIITTNSNQQLSFLHDRMPVILDAGSEALRTWLDPERKKWSKELQSLLKPYDGELECYPVSKDVGKVGNNSPDFVVPIDSKDNKKNIANFFGNARQLDGKIEYEAEEDRGTKDHEGSEDNAPVPVPAHTSPETTAKARMKRKHGTEDEGKSTKVIKSEIPPPKHALSTTKTTSGRKTRSATRNESMAKKGSPTTKALDGSQHITNFFSR